MNAVSSTMNGSARPVNTVNESARSHRAVTTTVNTFVNTNPAIVNTPLSGVNTATDPAALWAAAQAEMLPESFPAYGSDAWRELPPADPRRFAAALTAAELWRRHEARERWLASLDDDAWQREMTRDALEAVRRMRLSARPAKADVDALARPLPPHQLTATPTWPPIAIPGQPGRYLTHPSHGETA